MRSRLPPTKPFLGKKIDGYPNHVIQNLVGSGHNGHVFRAFDESTESKLAFKVVPFNNLAVDKDQQQVYLNEARKANVLQHPAVVKYHNVVPYLVPDTSIKCVVFVCDYVEGKNLRDYIRQKRSDIDIPFIEKFLLTMFGLLYELKQRKYQHGDLHAGNILVAISDFDMDAQPNFWVTDFGIRELTSSTADTNDYLHIARILKELLECLDYRDCGGRDRYVYNILKQDFLDRHLTESDTTIDPLACNPRALANKLRSLSDQYQTTTNETTVAKLTTPFDYPNCEQIGNSNLLLKNLYSDRLLGLSDIQAGSNLMLTGPRGCGKTTVFRALSLEYLIATNNDNPDDINYIGIYYRCDDLYFSFPRYKLPKRTVALDVPMHFLIVTLLATALEQIGVWAKKYFPKEFKKKEEALVADLQGLFGWAQSDSPSESQLATIVAKLKKERKRAAEEQRFAHVLSQPINKVYFEPGIMIEACQLIRNNFSFFLQNRPFHFFIDDYSHPKITQELQANLNRLFMHRSADVFFKLSTESPVSFARHDIDDKKFVEGREFDFINLGLRYITDKSNRPLEFLEDLFSRRFHEVKGYPIQTLEQLLGSKRRNENETARAFRKKKDRENYAYKETVAAMCSGDIHYIIRLVSRMVDDYGGKDALKASNAAPRIPPSQQHRSIRAAAGAFMESIRTLPGKGPQLTEAVTAFGNVAHSYLLYETSTNEESKPPHQASRIEPYGTLRLSDEAQEILNELLRYSVLIEDPRGKSSRGNIVPRFYLRRYLIPHFHLTFSRRDSLQLENHQIESLLCEPKTFEKMMSRGDPNQEDLFLDE